MNIMNLRFSFPMQKYAAKGGPEFFFIVNIQVDIVLLLATFLSLTLGTNI